MRYRIWNKSERIVMPNGTVYSAEEWKRKHPIAIEDVQIVCADLIANGTYFDIYEDMKARYEDQGVDFSDCTTEQEVLDKIYEEEHKGNEVSDETRMADALEDLVVLNMPDEEEE